MRLRQAAAVREGSQDKIALLYIKRYLLISIPERSIEWCQLRADADIACDVGALDICSLEQRAIATP